MSRSIRAWTESRTRISSALLGVGERQGRARLGRASLLGEVSVGKCLATMAAASVVVIGALPAVAIAKPASRSQTKHPTTSPHQQSRSNHAVSVTLALGSGYSSQTGTARVRALQRHLDAGGYSPGPIDGRYGPLTKEAVTRFQLGHELQVDGIAGPQTLTALITVTPVLYPGAGYQQDHGSPAVRDAQRRLAAAKDAPGPIDGLYGPLTTRAVERFQRARHLAVDGIVGSETWRALREATRPIANRPTPGSAPTSPPAPKSRQAPQTGRPHGGLPSLPVTFVLLALAALGVMTAAYSYARTRSRMRRAQAQAPHQERQLGAPTPAMRKTETRRRT